MTRDAEQALSTIAWMREELPKGTRPGILAALESLEFRIQELNADLECYQTDQATIEERLEELEAQQASVEALREKIADKVKRIVAIAKGDIQPPPQFHVGWEIRDLEDMVLWS